MNPDHGRKSDLQDELEAQRALAFFRPYLFADVADLMSTTARNFPHFHSDSQRERSKEKAATTATYVFAVFLEIIQRARGD
jgi:hypothetical protein